MSSLGSGQNLASGDEVGMVRGTNEGSATLASSHALIVPTTTNIGGGAAIFKQRTGTGPYVDEHRTLAFGLGTNWVQSADYITPVSTVPLLSQLTANGFAPGDTNVHLYIDDSVSPFALMMWNGTGYTNVSAGGGGGTPPPPPVTPPPPPVTPPPPPPVSGTCVACHTAIMLFDGRLKAVQSIVPGDVVATLNGKPGTVLGIHKPKLGSSRRMIRLRAPGHDVLRISDDHELWHRGKSNEQYGTYNYNHWLLEDLHDNSDATAVPLLAGQVYDFAVSGGWVRTQPDWEPLPEPNETLYGLTLDQGGGYIADGFVIMDNEATQNEIDGVEWKGVQPN